LSGSVGAGVGTFVGPGTFAGVGVGSGLGGLASVAVVTAAVLCVGLSETVGDSVGIGVESGARVSGTGVGPEHAVRVARIARKAVAARMDGLKISGSSIAGGWHTFLLPLLASGARCGTRAIR